MTKNMFCTLIVLIVFFAVTVLIMVSEPATQQTLFVSVFSFLIGWLFAYIVNTENN